MKPYPQPILLRLSDVSDVSANTAHRSAYVTTTLPAIVQGLRNLECQPDPYNEFQGPDALFSRLLATIAGTTEYDAVIGNEVERLNALYAEQVLANDALRRERDEARRDIAVSKEIIQDLLDRMLLLPPDRNCSCHISPPCNDCVEYAGIRETIEQATTFITTPTPGAQA